MKCQVTRLGSPVNIARLGRFDRNKTRDLEIGDALYAQLTRGRLWRVEKIKKPQPPAEKPQPPAKKTKAKE